MLMPHSGMKTGDQGKSSFATGNTETRGNPPLWASPDLSLTGGVNGYPIGLQVALVQGQRTKRHESREIGDEPINSTKGSETAGCVACQSEGIAQLGELAEKNACGAVDYHAVRRLRQWLCTKHKVRGAGLSRFSAESLYLRLGLVRLRWIKRNFP